MVLLELTSCILPLLHTHHVAMRDGAIRDIASSG